MWTVASDQNQDGEKEIARRWTQSSGWCWAGREVMRCRASLQSYQPPGTDHARACSVRLVPPVLQSALVPAAHLTFRASELPDLTPGDGPSQATHTQNQNPMWLFHIMNVNMGTS